MAPRQHNATGINPDGLPMTVGATYTREIAASLTRAWENVFDWEHLPWLHDGSFSACDLAESGDWGWRAWTRGPTPDAPKILIELVTDKPNLRYVSRTLEGGLPGMEIWTRFTELEPRRIGVEVEFHIPHLDPADAANLGRTMVDLYARLWDEDERMMVERQAALDRGRPAPPADPVPLGTLKDVRERIPFTLEIGGIPVRVITLDDDIVAFKATCPHLLGPLGEAAVDAQGCVTCPWHGYRFDVRTGKSADGRTLSLGPAPRIVIEDDAALLTWPNDD